MIAQTSHALSEFENRYTDLYKRWYNESNYIVCLEISNEEQLIKLMHEADLQGIHQAPFYEPDLDNQLTAVTFEPGLSSKRLLRRLPLALKDMS
jgi:hypothetical protein